MEIIASDTVELTPTDAADFVMSELAQAGRAIQANELDTALDGYARALGLALQLGPAPTEQVLRAVLQAADKLASQRDADGLSALGPTVVELVTQVRHAGVLPTTEPMEAWSEVTAEVGTLIGQVGLVLALAPDHREGMLDNAHARAALLDDATGALFALSDWLDSFDIKP